MKLICAWCNSLIADKGKESSEISHGICNDCAEGMMNEPAGLIRTFLDQLEYPVLMVDSKSRMYLENEMFKDLIGKNSFEIEGRKSGEIFNCIHWQESGECGSTSFCGNCQINKTVVKTFETGEPFLEIEASLTVSDTDGRKINLNGFISTQKVEGYVLLTIRDFSQRN